jgi:hypothetical protein
LEISVEKEAVVGSHPQGVCGVGLGLTLDRVRQVDGVGEVHGALREERLEKLDECILIGVVNLPLSHGQYLSRSDLIDHVALEAANRVGFVDENHIFVCPKSESL